MIVARIHQPAHKPPRVKPTSATRRCMAAALSLLTSAISEPMSSDAMLAERERLARDADAQRRRQGELVLRERGAA